MTQMSLAQAASTIGVAQNATLDEVNSAFRKLSLREHPDRFVEPGAKAAAEKRFAQISAARDRLQGHREEPDIDEDLFARFAGGFGGRSGFFTSGGYTFFSPGGRPFPDGRYRQYSYGGSSESGSYDYEDDYDYESDEDDYMESVFENMFRSSYGRNAWQQPTKERQRDTPEQANARMRAARDARQAAERRRAQETRLRKERKEREAAEEEAAAAERRKYKANSKRKSKAEAQTAAANKAFEARMQSQMKRSAAFTAARQQNAEAVKRAVYEFDVSASDGEFLRDMKPDFFAGDEKESLLHIAAEKGDLELVKWLLEHGATPEDRDTKDFTFFHRALMSGNVELIQHLFAAFSLSDEEVKDVTRPPAGETLLSLAILSEQAAAVRLVMPHSTVKEVEECYAWLDSVEDNPAVPAMLQALSAKTGFSRARVVSNPKAPKPSTAQPASSVPPMQPKKRRPADKTASPLQEQQPAPQATQPTPASPQQQAAASKPKTRRHRRKPKAAAATSS